MCMSGLDWSKEFSHIRIYWFQPDAFHSITLTGLPAILAVLCTLSRLQFVWACVCVCVFYIIEDTLLRHIVFDWVFIHFANHSTGRVSLCIWICVCVSSPHKKNVCAFPIYLLYDEKIHNTLVLTSSDHKQWNLHTNRRVKRNASE